MSTEIKKDFLSDFKKFSGNKLKNEEDLHFLINIVIKSGKSNLFEKTVFIAKYINGLKRVLKSGTGNPEITNIGNIREDMLNNYQILIEQLQLLLEGQKESEISRFQDKFLNSERESFERLNSLLEDLEWVKMYLNENKRI